MITCLRVVAAHVFVHGKSRRQFWKFRGSSPRLRSSRLHGHVLNVRLMLRWRKFRLMPLQQVLHIALELWFPEFLLDLLGALNSRLRLSPHSFRTSETYPALAFPITDSMPTLIPLVIQIPMSSTSYTRVVLESHSGLPKFGAYGAPHGTKTMLEPKWLRKPD